ncbi:P-loop containing nucleoside triphosphate hydrolase protein [Coprinopsis sp. MPI-PUGE-AT-0042]|nr:P-loop containing nucleoside triphosphate hydrolase protein [Coprinopsis sp. MPI-PUGE-AT-0042]
MTTTPSNPRLTFAKIREVSQRVFQKRACLWQCQVAQNIDEGKDVVVGIRTGAGKTLSFWLPLALAMDEKQKKNIIIVVTPLNLLGRQNEAEYAFKKGAYNAVIINPELLTDSDGKMNMLLRKPAFTDRLLSVVFDEAHCVSTWGTFRGAYLNLGMLRYMLADIPFYIASVTLPKAILNDVLDILNMKRSETKFIMHSNDRLDIHIMVKGMTFPINSYKDLAFLIPKGWKPEDGPPPKFLVFFDKTTDTEGAVRYLRTRLPPC